jgi:hypothetical protein
MNKITLIGTRHKEEGKCNADSLYNIIENINPDVIFEEKNPKYDYGENLIIGTEFEEFAVLEFKTVKKYIKYHNTKIVPIDTLDIKDKDELMVQFMLLHTDMDKDENGKELLELRKFMDDYCMNNGFEGINTKYYDNLVLERNKLYENYFLNYKKHSIEIYNKYIEYIIEKREIEMVNNIKKYHNKYVNNFNAVLLVGMDHRTSIIKKLEKIKNIEYNFYFGSENKDKPNDT